MSKIKVDTWENSSGLENYPCTAWVNFNGTGTVAIRDSGNVSSITDNGTGNYRVNFATSMNNANFTAVSNAGNDTVLSGIFITSGREWSTIPGTGSFSLSTVNDNAFADLSRVYIAFFGGR
jgi:hypothetical protein